MFVQAKRDGAIAFRERRVDDAGAWKPDDFVPQTLGQFRVRLHEAEGFRRIVKARPLCEFPAMSANIQNRAVLNRRKLVKKFVILKETAIHDPSDFGAERERLSAKMLQSC